MVKQNHGKVKLGSRREGLYQVVNGIEALIQACGRGNWIHASLWQMDNEEEFCELLEGLNCNFTIICEQYQLLGMTTIDLCKSINISTIEVANDQKALVKRLLEYIAFP